MKLFPNSIHSSSVFCGAIVLLCFALGPSARAGGALEGERFRVIVSTDIGGSDPDDYQSLAHFLTYADVFDVEGLISSPWGAAGRTKQILGEIDRYATDYPNLKTYSSNYPTPEALRAITKQGAFDAAVGAGYTHPTEGSDWIIRCAKRADPRPLWILVWGTIDDVAEALHDDPSIAAKLRVYYIAGPNKKGGLAAYNYIEENHRDLWIIENNATYRGWFVGGNQQGDLGNSAFVAAHVKGHGALGDYLASFRAGDMKMGDTPSMAYLLHGTPDDPTQPSWGGNFVRAWKRPKSVFTRLTTAADQVEHFGIFELALPVPKDAPAQLAATIDVDGQHYPGFDDGKGSFRFRFMPKDVRKWTYTITGNSPALNGLKGEFTSVPPAPGSEKSPDPQLAHWWADNLDPAVAEGAYPGAKTVSRWRADFLHDFAGRFERCRQPATGNGAP